MKQHQEELSFKTEGHRSMTDLTERVQCVVDAAGITTGLVNAFNIGNTGTLGFIEFEPGLCEDLPRLLDAMIPPGRSYAHEEAWHDGNGHSHLQTALIGSSLTVPVVEGRLALGTWQQIFHLECDVKARSRKIIVTVQGE